MKLSVFEPVSRPCVRLKLEKSDEDVILMVVDEYGHLKPGGNLLVISADGTISLCPGVEDFGFQLEKGRIKICD